MKERLRAVIVLLSLSALSLEPASLEVLFDGVPEKGGGWVLTATIKANEDLREAEMEVELSPGLSIAAGEPRWEGDLSAGDQQMLELSLVLTAPPPQQVTVRVKGRLRDAKNFEKIVVRRIK